MTEYTAQYIEETFTRIASIRISQKKSGDSRYTGDAGYWDGGRCEYGGVHNLQEDCQTLAKFFTKTSELKNTRRKLTSFNSQQEFDSLKQDLISQCNDSINGLQPKTGASTSVGGVCIIWGDFTEHLQSILDAAREDVEKLKRDIERTNFSTAKELKKLQLEETSLKKSIEENMRRTQNETDPDKKKRLLLLVDDDKKKLADNLEKQKNISVGSNFNADDRIREFIEKIEKKLNPHARNPRFPNPNQPNTPNLNFPNSPNDLLNPFQTTHSASPDWFQKNKTLIILAGAVLLIILYFYSQSEPEPTKTPSFYDYDF